LLAATSEEAIGAATKLVLDEQLEKLEEGHRAALGLGEACGERLGHAREAQVGFRPILMTDLVIIVGVLPLVLRGGTGSELYRPLAIVYIGGFVGALLLRVFIVLVPYEAMASLFDRRGGQK
jgi:hypothetical protein